MRKSEEFRQHAHKMVNFIADYYKQIETFPVLTQVHPDYLRNRLPGAAPYLPESLDTILTDVTNHIITGMTHWLSPNFFAFFPTTVSTVTPSGSTGLCLKMLCQTVPSD
jgi:aromatic-L-amino-acid decarboxylase